MLRQKELRSEFAALYAVDAAGVGQFKQHQSIADCVSLLIPKSGRIGRTT
jgi:hypothetical protein